MKELGSPTKLKYLTSVIVL